MSKITQFEELNCWKEARILVKEIYAVSKNTPLGKDYGLKDQIQRAAVSVMTNISEGFSRYHTKETIRFLDFAQSSAAEVRSLLYVIEDLAYLPPEEANRLRFMSLEVKKKILGLIKHLNTRSHLNSLTPEKIEKP